MNSAHTHHGRLRHAWLGGPRGWLLGALVLAALALPAAALGAASARPSLPVIERQVMCVTCKIPLIVAQSPQADRERAFIQGLIDQGQDETQIKDALVGQYGPAVLGLPRARGFDLTVYLVPLLAMLALLLALGLLIPRWRARSRSDGNQSISAATPLPAGDAARLDADLARFD